MPPDIHYIGLLRSPVSWAKVGRESIAALSAQGAYVSAVSLKGHLYDEAFPLAPEVEDAVKRPRRPGWDLALDYPPNFARLDGNRRAGVLIYEADRFPPHWAESITRHLDLAFVPSAFCLEAAVASGVPREKLALAPFGVDVVLYRPDGKHSHAPLTGRSFNFLTVAAPHVRKGLVETVKAFETAFSPSDDVGLVIKCPPLERLGRRPWEYRSVGEFLPQGRGGQVVLLADSRTEEEMAALYRAADVYVQASYGEGFGLSLVEALACGCPVVATAWGAAVEYLDEKTAWLADYDLIDASEITYDWPAGGPPVRMARPRMESLAAALRDAYEDVPRRIAAAEAAVRLARTMPWSRSAHAVIEALRSRSWVAPE